MVERDKIRRNDDSIAAKNSGLIISLLFGVNSPKTATTATMPALNTEYAIRVSLRIGKILDAIFTVAIDELRAMINQAIALKTIKITAPSGIGT